MFHVGELVDRGGTQSIAVLVKDCNLIRCYRMSACTLMHIHIIQKRNDNKTWYTLPVRISVFVILSVELLKYNNS